MNTKIYKDLGIEVTETLHYGKSFEEVMKLKPEGWRLLTGIEAMRIWEKEKFDDWFFVEFKGFEVVWFRADFGGINLYGDWLPQITYSNLGVRWCRKLEAGE